MTAPTEPLHVGDELAYDLGEGLPAFQESGLLWALNQQCLQWRGHQVRVVDGRVLLFGRGIELIQWPDEQLEAAAQRRDVFLQSLLDAKKFNNPKYWAGLSAKTKHASNDPKARVSR